MFRTRVFGGTPDAFQLACEYGPVTVPGSGNIPTPEALACMKLEWTSAESETQVLERFAQLQSALLLEKADERVRLQLSWEPIAHAESFPNQHLNARIQITSQPPVLRSLHFSRTSGSGAAPEGLITALLQHMDLSTVWKLRVSEGFPAHLWASCTEVAAWKSLFNLNISSSGLVSLPGAIGQLASLHVLRLNHNKLTSLPQELGQLSHLEVLSVNHNQLTTLPAELRRCSALRELHLEYNRLVTPLLDLTHATSLESLQLYGNPLEYLPELAPAVGLRSLSLANVRILADTAYSRWEVEVTAPSSSYTSMVMGGRGHKLQPLFNLVFRRSSVQHPLLAGAMSRLMEDPINLALLVREDVALQQLVLAAMGSDPLVVQQAVNIMSAVGAYAGAAKRLVKHNVLRAITGMLTSGDKSLQLSGLRVLSSLAAGAAEDELPGEVLVPTALLDKLLDLIRLPHTHQEVRCAALHALGNSAFDASNRRRYLQSPGLMQLLVMLAAAPDTAAPPTPEATFSSPAGPETALTAGMGAGRTVAQQQEAEAEEDSAAEGGGFTVEAGGLQPGFKQSTTGSPAGRDSAGEAGSLEGSHVAAVLAAGSAPLAPTPSHHSPDAAAGPTVAASSSPPTLSMSRTPSTNGTSASAQQVSVDETVAIAQSSTGSVKSVAVAAASSTTGAAKADGGASSSGAAAVRASPKKVMAAAAGAAAAAAAMHHTPPPAPAAAGTVVPAAPGSGKKQPAAGVGAAAEALLPKRRLVAVNDPVKLQAIRLLGILGQNEQVRIALGQAPIRGRGLRVLAMDGGGMKGMAMVELLRQLERRAGAPIWTLFDVIGGTSTGGLLAVSLGILRLNLDACQEIYTSLGNKVFNQSTAVQEDATWRDNLYRMYTTSSANMRVAVYGSKHDAANYEELLRRFCAVTELGCASNRLIDTAVMGGPKVFVVATLASSKPAAPFAFRNYELPDEVAHVAQQLAACAGSCKHHVWEAVRASSAAPYYLDDFLTADGKRFQDGATTANNPTVVALQQARLLHPQLPVDCVVSLGCGGEPFSERSKGLSSVIDTGAVLLESACSTDRVHEALATTLQLVPGCQYFRFNALDSRCAMELDDIRPESWTRLLSATTEYCSQPAVAAQFDKLAALLKQGSPATAATACGADGATTTTSTTSSSSINRHAAPLHVAGWHPTSRHHRHHQQQQQEQHLQQQADQLLLSNLPLRSLSGSSCLQYSSTAEPEGQQPDVQPVLQQVSAPPGPHSSAPRLMYQRGLLLVQASTHVAPSATAAAAAQGVDVSALQQQESVAQLLAAALPQDLTHTCDLSEVQHTGQGPRLAPQLQQQLQVVSDAADSKGTHSAGPGSPELRSPRHVSTSHTTNMAGSQLQNGPSTFTAAVAGAKADAGRRAVVLQRASDMGMSSLSSPKSSSWLEYLFPWQGANSAGNSPRLLSQVAGSKGTGQQRTADCDDAGAAAAASAGTPTVLPGGAWGSPAGAATNGVAGSPGRLKVSGQRRSTVDARPAGNGMQLVQSSPNLPPGSSAGQVQQQEAGSPGGSLMKIKSLPAHYHAAEQQHQVLEAASRGSRAGQTAAVGANQGSRHSAAAAAGSHAQQQPEPGNAVVSDLLRQHLMSAAGRVGVVHLALTSTQAGLVAGWEQQLTAVVEPGPEAKQLVQFLACGGDGSSSTSSGGGSSSSSSSLAQLVSAQGPVLSGPQGALVAVLAQQQVLAPVPAASLAVHRTAGTAQPCLGPGSSVTHFVTSWLLQLTLPDSSRMLGVAEVWPLLSQLQQLIVVSSSWLPKAMIHVLLRAGVAAVVCGTNAAEVAALDAADIAEFFRVFYAEGLWQDLDVVEALQAAIGAVPVVGDSAYECYQLMS